MVTDDVDSATVYNDGQLLRVVRTAIRQGVPPVKAIQYVTINTAQMLEKARWIGSVSPAKAADILIVSDLPGMVIDEVYSDGVLVAENGKMAVNVPPYDYPDWALHSVHLDKFTPEFFKISAEGKEKPQVRIMDCIPNELIIPEKIIEMQAVDGELKADPDQDLAKIFDIYRHLPDFGVTMSHGAGFIRGVGMKANCAYASTVAHDSHNLMVVGTSDEAMPDFRFSPVTQPFLTKRSAAQVPELFRTSKEHNRGWKYAVPQVPAKQQSSGSFPSWNAGSPCLR